MRSHNDQVCIDFTCTIEDSSYKFSLCKQAANFFYSGVFLTDFFGDGLKLCSYDMDLFFKMISKLFIVKNIVHVFFSKYMKQNKRGGKDIPDPYGEFNGGQGRRGKIQRADNILHNIFQRLLIHGLFLIINRQGN